MTRFAPASAMNISDNLIIKLAMVMMMMMRIPLGVVGGSGPLVGGTIAAWKWPTTTARADWSSWWWWPWPWPWPTRTGRADHGDGDSDGRREVEWILHRIDQLTLRCNAASPSSIPLWKITMTMLYNDHNYSVWGLWGWCWENCFILFGFNIAQLLCALTTVSLEFCVREFSCFFRTVGRR